MTDTFTIKDHDGEFAIIEGALYIQKGDTFVLYTAEAENKKDVSTDAPTNVPTPDKRSPLLFVREYENEATGEVDVVVTSTLEETLKNKRKTRAVRRYVIDVSGIHKAHGWQPFAYMMAVEPEDLEDVDDDDGEGFTALRDAMSGLYWK